MMPYRYLIMINVILLHLLLRRRRPRNRHLQNHILWIRLRHANQIIRLPSKFVDLLGIFRHLQIIGLSRPALGHADSQTP